MIGLVAQGTRVRVTDGCSTYFGATGVVIKVELHGVVVELGDGKILRRSWGLECVN